MLVAYLRGFLKPDFPNGRASRIREELLLESFSAELDSKALGSLIDVNSAFMSTISENRSGAYQQLCDKVFVYRNSLEFHSIEAPKDRALDAAERLAELYEVYEDTGVLDQLEKIHAEIDKDLQ